MSKFTRNGAPRSIQDLASGQHNAITVFSGSNAVGKIVFAANLADGDVVSINGVDFTAVTANAVGAQFVLGATLTLTLDAIVTVLNASADAHVNIATYAKSGADTLTVTIDAEGEAIAFPLEADGGVVTPVSGGGISDVLDPARNSVFLIDTAAGANRTLALGAGLDAGQMIVVYLADKGANANAIVSGVFKGGTKLTLDTADKFAHLLWTGSKWSPIVNTGAVAA